jgi:hypothetical protein
MIKNSEQLPAPFKTAPGEMYNKGYVQWITGKIEPGFLKIIMGFVFLNYLKSCDLQKTSN